MIDERYVNTYSWWLKLPTTKLIIDRAQVEMLNQVHAIDDSTLVGAAKGHYERKGWEKCLNFLTTQMTSEMLEKLKKQNSEPDYGAEAQVREDLFMEGE